MQSVSTTVLYFGGLVAALTKSHTNGSLTVERKIDQQTGTTATQEDQYHYTNLVGGGGGDP